MTSDNIIFAGIDISTGRKQVTLAALDVGLNIIFFEKCGLSQLIIHLEQYKRALLTLNLLSSGRTASIKRGKSVEAALKKKIVHAGFKPYLQSNTPKQWIETNPHECFRALIGRPALPRRSLEGRIQRALILYEQGLRINDPMDFFEEITRHHMLMGVLPNESSYSASELDALVAAYLAWSTINKPVQVDLLGEKKDGKTLVLTGIRTD